MQVDAYVTRGLPSSTRRPRFSAKSLERVSGEERWQFTYTIIESEDG